MIQRRFFLASLTSLAFGGGAHRVTSLKITFLSTGLGGGPGAGVGEWGISALVEADGTRILYDTGSQPDLVLRNSRALHLAEATPGRVDWTARELRKAGVKILLTGHCTGLAATDRLRERLHPTRAAAAVGAVGSTFTLESGISQPLSAL